jgi:peptide deformylase
MNRNIKNGEWFKKEQKPDDFEAFINPEILESSIMEEYGWDRCLTTPGVKILSKRHENLAITYYEPEKFE